jgi:hypothetical protein
MNYSKLSNGHLIPMLLKVGSMYATQWGLRQVVANVFIALNQQPMPTTAWGELV